MKTTNLEMAIAALCVALLTAALSPALGGTSSAQSNVTTVDTRDNPITVSGWVLAAATRAPINGAAVSLGGQNTSTAGDGTFALANVVLATGNTLTVSSGGYVTHTETASVPPGSKSITLGDILLSPVPASAKPVITRLSSRFGGCFIAGLPLRNEYLVAVNWNGLTPGTVRFYANGVPRQSVTGVGPSYPGTVDISTAFVPSLKAGANMLRVEAESLEGLVSEPATLDVTVIPLPSAMLEVAPGFSVQLDNGRVQYALDFDYPDPPLGAPVTLPFLGKFGAELSVNGSFDYTLPDGTWELTLGYSDEFKKGKLGRRPTIPGLARYPKLHFYIGNKTVTAKLAATLSGTALPASGITFDQLSVDASIEAELELGHFGVTDIFLPGSTEALNRVPGLKDVVSTLQAELTANLGASSKLDFDLKPQMRLCDGDLKGSVGVEASYKPKLLGLVDAEFSAGGVVTLTIGVPTGEFRGLHGELYGEAQFQSWIFTWPPASEGPLHAVFATFDITAQPSPPGMLAGGPSWKVYRIKAAAVPNPCLSGVGLMSRSYLSAGAERFLGSESALQSVVATGASALEDFRQLSQAPVKGSVMAESLAKGKSGGPAYSPRFGEPGSGTNQADLTLVQNAFPGSSPAMAARGTELMLLYVTDNGMTNHLQYTDIAWTRWDGTNWSVPLAIRTNTQAEFAPQVAYDGSGDAIAVWERVADPSFNQTNLTAMAAQMEIVWSRWSRTDGGWSEPAAITANSYLDCAPLLCGPMSSGNILAVWTKNEANVLLGTNAPGNDTVLWAEWSAASQSWGAPQVLVDGLSYRLSQSLGGTGDHAVYAWTADADGVLTNESDQEVFFMEYTNSAWGVPRQLATNAVADKTVRAAVATNGNVFLVWQSQTNLVLSRNFSTNLSIVRPDSQTAGFADYAATIGPLGHLVLLWQEMSTNGSDAHYIVYDPVAGAWGKDDLLCQDPPLERSFAPVWDDVGNLTVAYDKVQILHTNKTVTLEGGGTVTITNVPQSGRVDLVVTKRALVKDLALMAGDFTVQGVNYLPGDPLTLSATVHNSGNVAVSNVVVGFYDGNPEAGGVLVANVTMPGWLEAATTNVASALWIVPEPATNHTLYAVANQEGLAGEFDGSNNMQSVSIGGTDLAVSLVSQAAETNGAVRVIAQVQNLGAPNATNSVLAIRREGQTNAPLATVDVPLLEPGRLAQAALDLPAGTQPAGEALYRLFADDAHVVTDVDTNNNTTAFAVNLWIDSDGDGIPDDWMIRHFGHATGEVGDLSRAQDDADGDGLNNLAEYLAGTDPKNASSYLRITSVAVGGTNGVQVVWGSATNKLYSVQRAPAVGSGAVFTDLEQHILSTPPENSYLDSTATNSAAFFYRIRVE
jgi:hypothetical protein